MSQEHDFNRTFIAVQYPGIIQNVDKMLETLGGIENISTACSTANRRLELLFRPNDLYCKPACADRHNESALLLKVRVKKINKDLQSPSTSKDSSCDRQLIKFVKVVGFVNTVYKFTFPCDFQYLPVECKSNGLENIYSKLLPTDILDASWLTESNVPYFFPPATFSRMDTVEGYMFRKEIAQDPHSHQHIIGRTRRRRSIWGCFANLNDKNIPEKPRKNALNLAKIKLLDDKYISTVKKLFEERPIWSRNALICITKFRLEHMKYILPTVAYYFVNGPWRVMWVRFGYDPRIDPMSRMYQTLDYRLRIGVNLVKMVTPKRSYSKYLLPYKSSHSSKSKTVVINKKMFNEPLQKMDTLTNYNENIYIFRPGMIPPTRQMFYQYCDIYVPEIQNMLARLPGPGPDVVYSQQCGWMPQGMEDRCREIINNLVRKELEKRQQDKPSTSKQANVEENEEVSEDEREDESDDENDEDYNAEWEDI